MTYPRMTQLIDAYQSAQARVEGAYAEQKRIEERIADIRSVRELAMKAIHDALPDENREWIFVASDGTHFYVTKTAAVVDGKSEGWVYIYETPVVT